MPTKSVLASYLVLFGLLVSMGQRLDRLEGAASPRASAQRGLLAEDDENRAEERAGRAAGAAAAAEERRADEASTATAMQAFGERLDELRRDVDLRDDTCVSAAQFAAQFATLNATLDELRRSREVADARAEALEARVADLVRAEALEAQGAARRRTQRTSGAAEAAQILKIETVAISCPASSGRFGLTECQDPAFERCHRDACLPILEGHRRMQVGPQLCTAQTLPARTAAVNSACCPFGGCSGHHPDTCSAACAGVFLPWWRDCEVSLGKDGHQFEPTVQLCEAAGGTEVSIAMQLGVECTDGTATEECVPQCSEAYHGFLMLLNIGGEDSKLSCELHHGLFSWVGAAVSC